MEWFTVFRKKYFFGVIKSPIGGIKLVIEDSKMIIDIKMPNAIPNFNDSFIHIFKKTFSTKYSCIVILCIGTDRSTGDCLGPLIGHKLKFNKYENIFIYGTLKNPVHAKNLCEVLGNIGTKHSNPFIIAIDACLGSHDRVGCIVVGVGPLRPGAGVNKKLPEVGHMHIIGIVNVSGFMEYLILQNTRLNLVMDMADTISHGLHYNISRIMDFI